MAWTVRPRCSATSGTEQPVEVAQRQGRRGGGRRGGRAPRGRRRRRGGRPTGRRRARRSSATARRLRSSRACCRQWSTSLWRATPISHAVVEPRHRALLHRGHRGEERLGGEVLGHGGAVAAPHQVAVDLGQRRVVEREQGRTLVGVARQPRSRPRSSSVHDRPPTSVPRSCPHDARSGVTQTVGSGRARGPRTAHRCAARSGDLRRRPARGAAPAAGGGAAGVERHRGVLGRHPARRR